ncbi:sulfatase [Haladaptatus caseinilyticus]|uniref:sulfatase n=1 Tax=Haladaptatus caseinilyticus TaxID=2993314 RepID=UPI00224B8964|nr:sulfatase [Haladaptatus caseinilyticus]
MSSGNQNVILLSMDALRADHLSCYGYERNTSPNLDKLANQGILFKNAYSASSHTREAVPAILTGRYPDEAINSNYHRARDTVATHLKQEGYTTAGFHSNPFVSRAYGFNDGFDMFDDDLHLGKHKLIALAQRALDKLRNRHYARADEINERSLDWIDSLDSDQPFFLWNHYMDPHGPYEPFDKYRALYHDEPVSDRRAQKLYKRAINFPESISNSERKLLIDLYDAEIRYTDKQVKEFIDILNNRGLLNDTLLVITADHGDAFGERGYYEHPRYVHEELTRVPMIVIDPDCGAKTVETPVNTIDVVPTLLDAAETNADLPGRSLLEFASEPSVNRTIFMQARGEKENSHLRRFAARNEDAIGYATYNLEAEEIVAEEVDDEELSCKLEAYIQERVAEGETQAADSDRDEADEEIERRLAALGYKE